MNPLKSSSRIPINNSAVPRAPDTGVVPQPGETSGLMGPENAESTEASAKKYIAEFVETPWSGHLRDRNVHYLVQWSAQRALAQPRLMRLPSLS